MIKEIWLKSKEYAKENKIPYYHKVILRPVDDYKKDIKIYGPDVSEIIKYINENKIPTDNSWVIGSIEPNKRPRLVLSIDGHKGAGQRIYEHHYFRIIISLPVYPWDMEKNDLDDLEELERLMPELEEATKKQKEYEEEHKKLIELMEKLFSISEIIKKTQHD